MLRDLAKMIDHSLLHPALTDDDIRAGCSLARDYDVATAIKDILEEVRRRGYR